MSESHLLLALSNAVPGREREFADWYERVHMPRVLSLAGIVSARRYRSPIDGVVPYRFLTAYEIAPTRLPDARRALGAARDLRARGVSGPEALPLHESLAQDHVAWWFSPVPPTSTDRSHPSR